MTEPRCSGTHLALQLGLARSTLITFLEMVLGGAHCIKLSAVCRAWLVGHCLPVGAMPDLRWVIGFACMGESRHVADYQRRVLIPATGVCRGGRPLEASADSTEGGWAHWASRADGVPEHGWRVLHLTTTAS